MLLAVPPADFVLHNSLFLVAHFHNVIIGGVVFGLLAGVNYWFPKAFGYRLDPFWGKVSFWCWLTLASGSCSSPHLRSWADGRDAPRDPAFRGSRTLQIWFLTVAAIGAGFIIMAGILAFVVQLVVSYHPAREHYATIRATRGAAGPSNGRPPRLRQPYNFAFTPSGPRSSTPGGT